MAKKTFAACPMAGCSFTDMHGIAHLITRPGTLDRRSRKLLERFL